MNPMVVSCVATMLTGGSSSTERLAAGCVCARASSHDLDHPQEHAALP